LSIDPTRHFFNRTMIPATPDAHAAPGADAPTAPDGAPERVAAVGLFARKVAHDLNNFATVIRTYSELLLAELPSGTSNHADVSEIHRAADAMVAYVQRIARFSRAGGMRATPTDVDQRIREVVGAFEGGEPGAPVHFDATPLAASPTALLDGHWFADVLRELIVNAREASPAHGRVVVTRTIETAGAEGARWLVVSVSDQGEGFAEPVRANAEEPFVTTKDGVRGAGFGLTLASAFVRALDGQLRRERRDGTTVVSLRLPLG
jgi:signal transduction histidine kinase